MAFDSSATAPTADDQVVRYLERIEKGKAEQQDMNDIQIFFSSDYRAHKDSIPNAAPGTCSWFLSYPKYLVWMKEKLPHNLLWISGRAGCGKTVLSKFLIDHMIGNLDPQRITVCFFFFDGTSKERSRLNNCLRAILHQLFLANPLLIRHVAHAREEYETKRPRMQEDLDMLWRIFLQVTADKDFGSAICVIDAVDECEEDGQMWLVRHLKDLCSVNRGQGGTPARSLKFLLTSRPLATLGHEISKDERIDLEEPYELSNINQDIGRFVKTRIRQIGDSKSLPEDMLLSLEEKIVENAGNTYLWAAKVLEDLGSRPLHQRDIDQLISRLPPKLDSVYERFHPRSNNHDKIREFLRIVLAAIRPLTVVEMRIAMEILPGANSIDERRMQDPSVIENLVESCGGLISVSDSRIYPVHSTVRDFFIGSSATNRTAIRESSEWKHSLSLADSNLTLAEKCVSYLLLDEFKDNPLSFDPDSGNDIDIVQQMESYVEHHVFLDYAAKFWSTHVQQADSTNEKLWQMVNAICDTQSKRFLTWFQVSWREIEVSARCPQNFTDLMVASYCGLDLQVERLLEAKPNIKEKADNGWTALHCAASSGRKAILQRLLQHDAEVDDQDNSGRTPLHHAARNGHEDVLNVLLEKPANPMLEDKDGRTPLHFAASHGHEGVVNILIHLEAIQVNLDERDKMGRTPTHSAASNGYDRVLKNILEHGANIEAKDNAGCTALHLAASEGHDAAVLVLLEHKADVEGKDARGQTALHYAVTKGYETVVQILLSRGAHIEGQQPVEEHRVAIRQMFQARARTQLLGKPIDNNLQIDRKFKATIVEFRDGDAHLVDSDAHLDDGDAHPLDRGPGVDDILNGGAKVFNGGTKDQRNLRWVHLPANNVSMKLLDRRDPR